MSKKDQRVLVDQVLSLIGLCLVAVVTLLIWTPYIILALLSARKLSRPILNFCAERWARICLALFRIEVRIEGQEHLRERKARVVIVNHESSLELLWPCLPLPPNFIAVGKKEIRYVPFGNLMWWACGMIFIDRKNHQSAMHTLRVLERRLVDEKLSLLMAPEGTRSEPGKLLPFKKGAFQTATKTNTPLYPIVTAGAGSLLPRGSALPKPGTIYVRCLPPIAVDSWNQEDIEQHIEAVRNLMAKEIETLKTKLD